MAPVPTPSGPVTMTTLSLKTLTGAAAIVLSCAAAAAHADPLPMQTAVVIQPAASSVSRAEVQADFLVWRAAGMTKWDYDGADVFSADYRHDISEYAAIRRSPQFAVIERDIEQGHMPTVSVAENPLRVTIAAN